MSLDLDFFECFWIGLGCKAWLNVDIRFAGVGFECVPGDSEVMRVPGSTLTVRFPLGV